MREKGKVHDRTRYHDRTQRQDRPLAGLRQGTDRGNCASVDAQLKHLFTEMEVLSRIAEGSIEERFIAPVVPL
jgi:hypothetical protein